MDIDRHKLVGYMKIKAYFKRANLYTLHAELLCMQCACLGYIKCMVYGYCMD